MARNSTAAKAAPTQDRGTVMRDGLTFEAPDEMATVPITDMKKLPIPQPAEGNEHVVYAVRFSGRCSGFYRASLVKDHDTALVNPDRRELFPKMSVGEARGVDPKYWESPELNLIGRGQANGFYVDFFKDMCYVDPRAAAAGTHPSITAIYLWCPHFESDRPGSEQRSEHGAYLGLIPDASGQMVAQPDDRYAQPLEDLSRAGWCPRCDGDKGRLKKSWSDAKRLNDLAPTQE